MFSTAQIVGLAALTLAVIVVAFILMRLDSAIGTLPVAEEDGAPEADAADVAAAVHRPSLPAGGKKLPRSQRKHHSL